MKKQVIVIGLGRFGFELARSLSREECEVIGIDKNEEKVKAIADHIDMAVTMDAMNVQALKDIGVKSVDIAVVSIGENIEANVLSVVQLKKLGIKNIIAKAVNDLHKSLLEELNVSEVIFPERDMAKRLAKNILKQNILETVEVSDEYSLVELTAPKTVWDRSIIDSRIRSKHSLSIIGIRHHKDDKEELLINPMPTTVIVKGDTLILLGRNTDIEKFKKN